jgi:hypothetical protein
MYTIAVHVFPHAFGIDWPDPLTLILDQHLAKDYGNRCRGRGSVKVRHMRVLILGAGPQLKDNETPVWLAEAHGEVLVERFVNACKGLGSFSPCAGRTCGVSTSTT